MEAARFAQALEQRHEYARAWKARTGGRVVGYLCTYVPEELIYAAGALPVRILGSREPQDVTEPYIASHYCAWCRDALAQGLRGRYDYIDGLVTAHTCMHIRQTYTSWTKYLPVSYSYYFYMPGHVQSPLARDLVLAELAQFQTSLEEWTGKPIPREAIKKAVQVYNANRRLLGQVYQLRKGESPFSGSQVLEMVLSSMVVDKKEHSRWLAELLATPPQVQDHQGDIRLMLLGSIVDDMKLVEMVESLGARIVADDLCSGFRYFWKEASEQAEPLSAIADWYLGKPPCPMKDLVERRRPEHVLQLAREYGVQGVIFVQQKFCDPHGSDFPSLAARLKEEGLPSLRLETDVTTPAGQFRTRVEAFLEMLQMQTV